MTGVRSAAALLVAAVNAGCMLGPNYERPPTSEGGSWHEPLRAGLTSAEADGRQLATWWTVFDDPVLSSLESRAAAGNLDLGVARHRVHEARAQRAVAEAGLFPTVRATLVLSPVEPSSSTPREGTGFHAAWIPDVFGGLRRGVEAAIGDQGAREEDLHDVLVNVEAEVAQSYVDVRSLQARLAIAEQNLEAQSETARIATWRAQAGLTTALDVEQAQTNVEQTRAQIPDLRASLARAKNRLDILVGEIPGTLADALKEPGSVPRAPEQIAVGIPADTLLRRPDVRRAERQLAAETARIGVAKAAAYPQISLSGAVGTRAISPHPASISAAAANEFAQVIFDHGEIRARIRAQKAVREEALDRFRSTALAALEQVEDGIASYSHEQERRGGLVKASASADRAARLSRERYAAGLTDFQTVLDAERTLYSLQDQLVLSEQLAASDLVDLYRALGGGWTTEEA